mmetsp:Transcript_23996/g.60774  ORF Transcript_23996/g.60774 Transcript_23996/m.60774 type:complete len:202 (+) Transcript_23996:501-1106(+)
MGEVEVGASTVGSFGTVISCSPSRRANAAFAPEWTHTHVPVSASSSIGKSSLLTPSPFSPLPPPICTSFIALCTSSSCASSVQSHIDKKPFRRRNHTAAALPSKYSSAMHGRLRTTLCFNTASPLLPPPTPFTPPSALATSLNLSITFSCMASLVSFPLTPAAKEARPPSWPGFDMVSSSDHAPSRAASAMVAAFVVTGLY